MDVVKNKMINIKALDKDEGERTKDCGGTWLPLSHRCECAYSCELSENALRSFSVEPNYDQNKGASTS